MQDAPERDDERPPFGSWSRTYLLVAALAVVVMLLLWAVTVKYDIRSGT